jgi:hypothetical protein
VVNNIPIGPQPEIWSHLQPLLSLPCPDGHPAVPILTSVFDPSTLHYPWLLRCSGS